MSRFLIATWDGAGNLAPTLGIARTLVERGHDVRLMGQRTIVERWGAMDYPGDFEAEIRLLIDELCFSSTISGDLAKELDREPADAVVVDCMLYVRAGSTPLVLVSLSTSEQGQADLLQRCVDAVAQLPVNAIVTTGPSIDPASVTAGANTQVARYAPHADILPSASLVITHAGLGTTMAALGHGVPLLCVPMGRDQFFNAERVQDLGAGRMLMPDVDSDAIARAAKDIIADSHFTAGAKRMADAIGGYGGAARAAAALEALV